MTPLTTSKTAAILWILVVAALIWRGLARVTRSEVLKLRELPYIRVAKVSGASDRSIIYRHVLPSVLPIGLIYFAGNFGAAIGAEATLSFLGVGAPFQVSWGTMMQLAIDQGALATGWWWILPPASFITVSIAAAYLISAGYRETSLNSRRAQ